MLARYVHAPGIDRPIVWYEGAGLANKRYLMSDERGSVTSITSASGAVLAINTYDEYGIPAAGNLGRFQYTGQMWLEEIGLYHYKARMYSPTLGRFMQTDPLGYADGMNLYAYVGNDPINFTDPLGLHSCADYPWGWTTFYDLNSNGRLDDSDKVIEMGVCPPRGGGPGAPSGLGALIHSRGGSTGEQGALGGTGGGPQNGPCEQSGLNTLIGAASAVGGFAQDVGDVGQIIGGGVAFVNPVLGGAIFAGSKVISGAGTGLEVGAALGDA